MSIRTTLTRGIVAAALVTVPAAGVASASPAHAATPAKTTTTRVWCNATQNWSYKGHPITVLSNATSGETLCSPNLWYVPVVKIIQKDMNAFLATHHIARPLLVDGWYGKITARTVAAYQRYMNRTQHTHLPVNGLVGKATNDSLMQTLMTP